MNDINAINKETGGWIASEDDKAPWWETNFKEQVNGITKEFLAELKGIYTQGLSGYKGRPDWMLWTKKPTKHRWKRSSNWQRNLISSSKLMEKF